MNRISALLVEDSPDDARLIERILKRGLKNITLTCVDNMEDFKAELGLHNYSLVITDLNVGEASGFDFISYLHQQRIKKPIIMVTATNDKAYTMKALEMQVDDYVSKSYKYLLQLPYIILRVLNFPPSEMIEHVEGLDLKKIGEEYTDIFNANREISFKLWLDGSFMSTNRNFERLMGFEKSDLANMPLRELVDAASLVEFDHLCEEIKLGKQYKYTHLKLRDKYGKEIDVEAQIESEMSANKVIASNWNIRDITNLRAVQKSFLNHYRQYASVFKFNQIPTLLIDNRGSIMQINPAACRHLGYEADAILGTNLIDSIEPEYREQFAELLRQQMDGREDRAEIELVFSSEAAESHVQRVRMTVIRNGKHIPRFSLLEIIN